MSETVDMAYEKQKIMITNLLSSPDLFALCSPIISPEYFLPELRQTVRYIMEYYETYNNTPSSTVILAEAGLRIDDTSTLSRDQFEYTADSIEAFCKKEAIVNEVLQSVEFINNGDYGGLIERMEKAVLISLQRNLGINLFEDVQERIEQRLENRKPISTGMSNVDEILGGGVNLTELVMCSANSGGGKSVFLANLSINFAKQGYDVLYISLELSEDMMADRLETMITGWNKNTKFDRISETVSKLEQFHMDSGGDIFVKYMEAESNTNDIKAYLKEFELQFKKLPTLLVVDYLDIFGTNERVHYSNVFDKDKASSTQLRTIGNTPHHQMVIATASQQNRSAIGETDMNQGHIAGGLSKVNISDVYLSIIMSDVMRAEGLADFLFLKTRSADGVGKLAHMKWNPTALTFTPLSGSAPPPPQPSQSNNIPSAATKNTNDSSDLMDLMDF